MKNNICIIFISLICIVLLVGCGGKKTKQKTEVKNDMTVSQEEKVNVGKYLFNADEMESIEISGKDLRKRKKCEMSTEITEGETLDFVIKREDVGEGISMKVFSENQSIDLISNLGESLEEEWTGTGAKKGFFYQMAACDVNGDGEKEIIIAGGNKKDVLELRVLQVKKNLEFGYGEEEEENPQLIKRINGGYKAYLNDEGKICVIDEKNHKENIEIGKNRRTETREETPISKLYDWKQAEIKNIGDGSNFGAVFVVQNEKYIFFPQNGNKVVRLDKNNKNVKTIYEFKESKEKEIGLHLCQGENGFFIEYEGNIFLANYDGSKIDKIISSNEIREEVSRNITDIEDFCEICSIHYYNKKIYFISRMNIYEYNLATKEIKLLGEDLLSACFRKNELYYVSYGFTVIYKVNLSTYKRKRVCGKKTIASEVKNSDTIKYYKQVMEIDNKIYYARQQNGKKPVIYQYCENGKDRKVYEYPIQSALVLAISGDSEKFVCECFTDGTRENIKLMIYDVKTSVLNEVNMHDDRITFESILGDMIFYAKDDSDYLSYCLF